MSPIKFSFRRTASSVLSLGSAAGCLVALPALAGSDPGAAQLRLDAPQTTSNTQVAQTYGTTDIGVVGFQQPNGWYLTVGAGASQPSNSSINGTATNGASGSGTLDFGGGFALDAGVGYDFGAIRTELTYSYNNASLNGISGTVGNLSASTTNVSGVVNKNDVFLSAYWDIPGGGRWVPYIGGGLGYTNLSTPNITLSNGQGTFSSPSTNQGLFGWQAKAGIAYALATNWDIYAEGVYQGASGFTNQNVNYGSFNNWGGKLGFRYRFGHVPQAVVVQPAPAPAPAPVYEQPAPAPAPQPAPAPVRGLW